MDHLAPRKDILLKLVKDAGFLALDFFKNYDQLKIDKKASQDFVSKADKEVEKFITKELNTHFPNDNVLGEEFQTPPTKNSGVWVVDPIDGTLPFLMGLPNWCVSIAYVWQGKPVLGAVFDPNLNELFFARRGQGSFLNDRPITVNKNADLNFGMVACGYSPRSDKQDFLEIANRLLTKGSMIYKSGSGAAMICYVAAGRLNAYFEPHINSWDVAAAFLICQEAGLSCSHFTAGNWLLEGGHLLVAPPAIYQEMVKMLTWRELDLTVADS